MGAAQVNDGENNPKVKKRAKRQFIKIDMTPMVDLAFLLLTFFILATTLAKEKTIDLIMPADGKPNPVNNAINLILSGGDKIYYYTGELHEDTKLAVTSFDNIRNIITKKNEKIVASIKSYKESHPGGNYTEDSVHIRAIKKLQADPAGVVVVIKYDSLATYRNTIDIVDEMEVSGVASGKYAIVKKLEPNEKLLLRKAKK